MDKKYAKMVGLKAEKINEDIAKQNKINKAFDFANNCRDKEIDRFWTRGLYFWGFIVASFGTYMAVLNASLKIADSGERVRLSFFAFLEMSFVSKAILDIVTDVNGGLTLRIMDGLYFEKKVITNNRTVKDYDFYHPNNFFVIGMDDISQIHNFLSTEYQKSNENIKEFYELKKWLERF